MKIKKEVEHAHPLGKNTVMVKFLSFKDHDLVGTCARKLKGSNPLLSVREDVSELSLSLSLSLSHTHTHTHACTHTPKVLAFSQKLVIQLTHDRIL